MRSALFRTVLGITATVGMVCLTVQLPHVEGPVTARSTAPVTAAPPPTPARVPAVDARHAAPASEHDVAPTAGTPGSHAAPPITPPIRRENAVESPHTRPTAEVTSPAVDKLDSALQAAVSGDPHVRYRVIVQSSTGRRSDTRDLLSQAGAAGTQHQRD